MFPMIVLRRLVKSPGYTAAAVGTLALAIGANSAMFSAVYGVLLHPLPIRLPNDLVICWGSDVERGAKVVELSYRNFEGWAARGRSFSQTAAVGSSTWPAVLEARDGSVRLSSAGVSVSFFDTLGVAPALGRGFRPEDDEPNAPRVLVLSHKAWVTEFGADRSVIGTTLRLAQPTTVVGVMPEAFDFPRGTDFWTPVVPILADSAHGWHTDALENVGVLFVVGRLRHGATPEMAAAELDHVAQQLDRDGFAHRFGTGVVVTPFLDYLVGSVRQVLWALFAAVALLLMVGCANVSGLMVTRASLRRREHAVRLALGASRSALARMWTVEALVVSAAGGVLGLMAARGMLQAIVSLTPDDVPRLADVTVNLPVAGFTFLAVLVAALACGAGPVRQAARADIVEALAESAWATPAAETSRLRSLLLVVQIALAVVLLIAAGLVVRSFTNLRRLDLGFAPDRVLTMNVSPSASGRSANEWINRLVERVSPLPGVEAAGAVYLRPLALGAIGQDMKVTLEGQPNTPEAARQNPTVNYEVATPGYFRAMRIPLRQGRLFDAHDDSRSPEVALVSESAARRLWPGEDAIGKRILMPTESPDGPRSAWRTVVGLVGDVRYRGIDDLRLDVYDAVSQSPAQATDLVVETAGDPVRAAATVEAVARAMDPRVVIDRVTTMDAIVAREMAPWRFSVWMFGVFATLAFVLASGGLFTRVALEVANRRREFAVRMALGAEPSALVRSAMVSAGRWVLVGVACGLAAAVAASRGISRILYQVSPVDAATYVKVIALVAIVVAVAAYLPARRASQVDALELLRRSDRL
jgi:putative ABC transport system permease protein